MNNEVSMILMGITYILPLFSLILIIMAVKKTNLNFTLAALWCSLIALIVHYQLAGDEILGGYFNSYHATLYSITILLFLASSVYASYLIKPNLKNKLASNTLSLTAAVVVTGSVILLINLWVNASFVDHRFKNTPIVQVPTLNNPAYCQNTNVLLKVTPEAKVAYLCPNGYGLIASTGKLDSIPKVLLTSLPKSTIDELSSINQDWQQH